MYEIGLLIALLLWLATSVIWIAERYSQRSRNLRRMGFRLSLLGDPRPMEAADLSRPALVSFLKWAFVLLVGFVLAFTSWLYVAAVVGGMLWNLSKRTGAPPEVREFHWRLRNMDLSLDELIRGTMRIKGVDESHFDETKAAIVSDLRERGLA